MANAALTTFLSSITKTTPARAGLFHGHQTRKAILETARTKHAQWASLYETSSLPYWQNARQAGRKPIYFNSLRRVIADAVKEASYIAECAAFHAAELDAKRHATAADAIRREIHSLEMADFHTVSNRAEVARLQGELAKLAA